MWRRPNVVNGKRRAANAAYRMPEIQDAAVDHDATFAPLDYYTPEFRDIPIRDPCVAPIQSFFIFLFEFSYRYAISFQLIIRELRRAKLGNI